MNKYLEKVFYILLSIALLLFIFILLMEYIDHIGKDYRFAIIGALGSIIGGSLTLVGVWLTIKIQFKSNFINEFPKKIRMIDHLKEQIRGIPSGNIFKDIFYGNQSIAYKQMIDNFKVSTTEIDGKSYFIVCKLDNLYEDFVTERKEFIKYRPTQDKMERPIPTEESITKLKDLENEYTSIINSIANELDQHGKNLIAKFFKYKGNE
ncbi:MAG: hypothetical protein Q8934_15640 [Bacillota bacterium]|nr:hypothetical protein [Bacillota bacterium]